MKTQEKLIDLGEAAMRVKGYAGFSYADIARDAGIRKASIHHHFPTKADLGFAVLDRYANQLADALSAIAQTHRPAGAKLLDLIELYRDACSAGSRLCLCVALSSDLHALDDKVRTRLVEANGMIKQWIEHLLLEGRKDRSIQVGGDPALEAAATLAQLQGAQLMTRAAANVEEFSTAISTLVDRVSRR